MNRLVSLFLAFTMAVAMVMVTSGCPADVYFKKKQPVEEVDYSKLRKVQLPPFESSPPPPTKEDIPRLFTELGSENEGARWNSSFYLARFVDERGVLEGLLEALDSDDALTRRGAAQAISYIDPAPAKALPVLINHFENGLASWESKSAILKYTGDWETIIPALIDAVRYGSNEAQNIAAAALGEIGPAAKEAAPYIADLLYKKGLEGAIRASGALAKFGPGAVDVLPIMVETVGDTWSVAHGKDETNEFVAIGPESILFLLDGLDYGTEWHRSQIVVSLVAFGEVAFEPVKAALDSDDPIARMYIAEAFRELGGAFPGHVPALVEVIHIGDKDIARKAIKQLEAMGPDAGYAIPALLEAGYTYKSEQRSYAKDAIRSIGIENTYNIQGLIDLLNHDDKQVQEAAIEALGVLDARATCAVPILMEMLEDDDTWPDSDIREALGEILPSFEAIPYFVGILESDARHGRADAVKYLKRHASTSDEILSVIAIVLDEIGTSAMKEAVKVFVEMGTDALPVLIEVMGGESVNGKINAMKTLAEIVEDASDAVPALIEMLGSENHEVRIEAIETLIAIGPASRDALTKLRDLAENDQYVNTYSMKYTVRRAARDAIAKIEAMEEE